MKFTWHLDGVETPASPGAMRRGLSDGGVVEFEQAGEVVSWLANGSPVWDLLDTDYEFTITITPAPREDKNDD